MRLESFRDLKSGSIRVEGDGFSVTVLTDGRVAVTGSAMVVDAIDLMVDPPSAIGNDSNAPSPRSRPSRRRGSR
jgi:hypothetical protein